MEAFMKKRLMLVILSVLSIGLQAKNDKNNLPVKNDRKFRATHVLRVHEQDGIRFRFNGKRITQKEVIELQQKYGFTIVDKYSNQIKKYCYENALSAFENEGGSIGTIRSKAPVVAQELSMTPALTAPKKVWKVVKLHEQIQAPARISGVEVLQAANQLADARKSEAHIRKGAAAFLAKQHTQAMAPNVVESVAQTASTAVGSTTNVGTTTEKLAVSVASSTAKLPTPTKVAGGAIVVGSVGFAAYKYHQHVQAKAEAERLANRSYFEKTYDSISDFAKSAKMHTWDSNYGFNHSGKVATVAGVAAVAGLSYLAYKKNPFGKAIEPTVAHSASAKK